VSYEHDAFGRLTAVTLAGGRRVEYVLDGLGRRVGKRVDGVMVQALLWEGDLRVAAELDGAGAVVTRFVHGDGDNVPELAIRGGRIYRLVTDHLGSVRLVIDSATGEVAARMEHDEHGVATVDEGPLWLPFGFAGGLYDRDTGLVLLGARDYDPRAARWITPDPLGVAGGTNLYAYAGGDPAGTTDPTGTQWNPSVPVQPVVGPLKVPANLPPPSPSPPPPAPPGPKIQPIRGPLIIRLPLPSFLFFLDPRLSTPPRCGPRRPEACRT
jgi:RHS repeat-associated protein